MDRVETRKRHRNGKLKEENEEASQFFYPTVSVDSGGTIDPNLFDIQFPPELELELASVIFDLGLKKASPKLLMPLMPHEAALSTEHIKSHLQKYRIHKNRSKEEFQLYYEKYVRDHFHSWESRRCWEQVMSSTILTSTDTISSAITGPLSISSSSMGSLKDAGSSADPSNYNDSDRQEQLRKKLHQIVEVEELLAQSSATLQRWKDSGSQAYEQCVETQRDISVALSSLEATK